MLPGHRLGDVLRLHLRVGRVKHPNLMPVLAQDRCQCLDSQGRKRHHFDSSFSGLGPVQFLGQYPAEIVVAHMNEKHIHRFTLV
jgi:hypothetical protein